MRLLLPIAVVAAAACGPSGRDLDVRISPEQAEVVTRTSRQFEAEVGGSFGDGIVWSVVVGPGTISSGGLYTAPPAVPRDRDNEVVVRATSAADDGVHADAQVRIVAPPIEPRQGPTAGGTRIVIDGAGFVSGMSVLFDGLPGTGLTVESQTRLRVNTPPNTQIGAADVRLLDPSGVPIAEYPLAFTYGATHPGFALADVAPGCFSPTDAVFVDLDGENGPDGFDDLVTSCLIFEIAMHRNDGRGGFERRVPLLQDDLPIATRLFASDVDQDLDLDVVALQQVGAGAGAREVAIYENEDGALVPGQAITRASGRDDDHVAAGTLTDDIYPDIAFADGLLDRVGVLAGGAGGFTGPFFFDTAPGIRDLELVDLDGNGMDEVVATTEDGFQIVSEPPLEFPTQALVRTLAVGRFDGDAFYDVLTSSLDGGLSVRYGTSAFAFGAAVPLADSTDAFYSSFRVVNLDADVQDEVLAHPFNVAGVRLFDGGPAGLPDEPVVLPFRAASAAMAVGDVDGEPGLDVVVVRNEEVEIRRALSPAVFAAPSTSVPGAAPAIAYPAFVADGEPAIAVPVSVGSTGATVVIARFGDDGIAATDVVALPDGSNVRSISVADLDGDGLEDLLVPDVGLDVVWWSRQAAAGAFEAPEELHSSQDVLDAIAADLDRDGNMDLLVTQGTLLAPGRLLLRWGAEDGSFDDPVELLAGVSPLALAAADVDDDGTLDIVATDLMGASVAVIGVGTDRTFTEPTFVDVGETPTALVVRDLDGDYLPELVVQCSTILAQGAEIHVARGRGAFQFDAAQALPLGLELAAVAIADLDADGLLDLLLASQNPAGVLVQRARSAGDFEIPQLLFHDTGPATGMAVVDYDADGLPDPVLFDADELALRVFANRSK